MPELKRTPLYDFHISQGARMVPFAGYEMPVQYAGILQEHISVRKAAGVFDVSHMGEARIQGAGAVDLIDYVACNNLSNITAGKAIYSPLCNEKGGVVDDVIVYCLRRNDCLVVLNASNKDKDIDWLKQHAKDFDCTVTDESEDWALLAVQGPHAFAVLEEAGFEIEIEKLGRFSLMQHPTQPLHLGDGELLIARTGYTGEDGVELFCSPDKAEALIERLLKHGAEDGIVMAGLAARDSLRLEAGYPLYGHEITDEVSPLAAGLGWTVKLKHDKDFIGKAMLEAEKLNGPEQKTLHFIVEDRRIAREGSKVYSGDSSVGIVVSGAQSPIIGKPIGSARIDAACKAEALEVEIRGKRFPISVKRPPLHL